MSGPRNPTSTLTIEVDGQLIEDNFDKATVLAANQNYSTTFLVKKVEMEKTWKRTAEQTSKPTAVSSLNEVFTYHEFKMPSNEVNVEKHQALTIYHMTY